MKNIVYPLIAAFILLTSATSVLVSTFSYKVKEGHSIRFESKDPSGVFKKMQGDVIFDEKNLDNSSFNLSIDVASISTGNGMKNKKAMTSEWFSAAKYPKIEFKSTKLVKTEKGYQVHGNMMLKGVKRFRKIPMNVVKSKGELKFVGSFWVDRSFYKIGKPSKATPNKLKIIYSIPVTKK